MAQRARIVLLAEQGLTGPQIAERVGCSEPMVVLWRDRYAQSGLAGLNGTVNLLGLLECMGMVGSVGWISGAVGQAAVAVPVTSFQVVNRTVISWRYSSASRR